VSVLVLHLFLPNAAAVLHHDFLKTNLFCSLLFITGFASATGSTFVCLVDCFFPCSPACLLPVVMSCHEQKSDKGNTPSALKSSSGDQSNSGL
jgi:hypothetical protein